MSEILKFIKLDFITFKNELGRNRILIFLLFTGVFYFVGGLGSLVAVLPLFLSMLTTQNFSAGNDGLDIFYVSLQLKRRSVVLGRYCFLIVINILVLLLLFGLSFFETEYLEPHLFLLQILSVLFLSTVISFFNIPFLFKVGFKKGNIITQSIPIILMLGMVIYVNIIGTTFDAAVASLLYDVQSVEINLYKVLLVWLGLLTTSICLSLKFYTKRELG